MPSSPDRNLNDRTPRGTRRPRRARLAGSTLVLVLGTLVAAGPSAAAELAAVERAPLDRTLVLAAELRPYQEVDLRAKVTGFVERIDVDRGSAVRKGTVVAVLRAPELEAQTTEADARLVAAEASLAEAQARLAGSESTHRRLARAAETPGAVAGNDLLLAEQAAAADRARVAALTKEVDAARAARAAVEQMRDYLRIAAPFDGVVTERHVHPGTLVGPGAGGGPLVRVEQVERLRLVIPVPESEVAGVRAGEQVSFSVSSYPGERFAASVARAAGSVGMATRTMAVEADVENPDRRLAPGMYAEVSWPSRRAADSLFVPRSAVAETTEKIFVIRVRDGKAEWVDVRRGAMEKDRVEVFGDLAPGDRVLLHATDEIRPGTAITEGS